MSGEEQRVEVPKAALGRHDPKDASEPWARNEPSLAVPASRTAPSRLEVRDGLKDLKGPRHAVAGGSWVVRRAIGAGTPECPAVDPVDSGHADEVGGVRGPPANVAGGPHSPPCALRSAVGAATGHGIPFALRPVTGKG